MRRQMFKKFVTAATLSTLFTSALVGCSGSNDQTTVGKSEPSGTAPFKMTMMSQYESAEPPTADNPVVRHIEEVTNTKLNITWVLNSNYTDKLNVTMASGDLPQALLVVNTQDTVIVNAAQNGFFWDVEPYLKDYPNLSKLDKDTLNNTRINGKIYGIYRGRYAERIVLFFRQDWLNNVGIKEAPKTVDDYYKVLKAFTYNDPDKDGKQNTWGITENKDLGTYTFPLLFGAPNNWGYINNEVVPDFSTKEYMDYLKFMKKLYDEKILNQDFATVPGQKVSDDWNQGKIGIRGNIAENYRGESFSYLGKTLPGADVHIIPALVSTTGQKRVQKSSGFLGMYMFPKSSVKTEADLKQVLSFFDKMADDKLVKNVMMGVEGVHYKEENGIPKIVDDPKYNKEVVPVVHLASRLQFINNGAPLAKEAEDAMKEIKQYGVPNVTDGIILSDDSKKKLSTNKKIIDDAKIKFIMGVIDEAGFNKDLDRWKQAGGNDVIKEYTELYKKFKK
ncbi:extracellular solute-binding protein [Paenibacillus sp. WQ 127069]|uniref:Extracellular solute-binding protein n=1 Tax=Paenibacillus baimaensis TaxID=2982185 RepID=A0ABT2UDP4_9BACL|nr:extracellular solute-binding protein [Paenibacillus sp. WQ 127069]MCU6792730.1 extracellular solute-binding protein [Paenibacillus sp. WQ 127069]